MVRQRSVCPANDAPTVRLLVLSLPLFSVVQLYSENYSDAFVRKVEYRPEDISSLIMEIILNLPYPFSTSDNDGCNELRAMLDNAPGAGFSFRRTIERSSREMRFACKGKSGLVKVTHYSRTATEVKGMTVSLR